MLDVGLDLLFHPIPYITLSKSIVCGLYALMSGDRHVMKVRNKQLALLICPISDVNQLNSYQIQEYLILIVIAQRYVVVRSPAKQICNVHLASFFIDKLV